MTLEEAKSLYIGQTIYFPQNKNSDGTPQRWRVNGMYKTWKTKPGVFKLPIKNGLRNCDYLTNKNYTDFTLTQD